MFTSLRDVMLTTAGAEDSTSSEMLIGSAALEIDESPSANKIIILRVGIFMLLPLVN
jgi:hypothetical protein